VASSESLPSSVSSYDPSQSLCSIFPFRYAIWYYVTPETIPSKAAPSRLFKNGKT
jgi:hypothetical protein